MTAIVWNDVIAHASELSTIPIGAQTDLLAYVNAQIDVSIFSDGEDDPGLKLARIYLAAHLATSVPANTLGGQIKSQSAGGLSRSYGPFHASNEALESTIYGRKYLSLIRRTAARAPVII